MYLLWRQMHNRHTRMPMSDSTLKQINIWQYISNNNYVIRDIM